MSDGPEISVIIPAHNGGWVLRRAVESLVAQDLSPDRYEILVVDDGSTDGSTDDLTTLAGRATVRVLRQAKRGRAAARNHGASAARGRVLLFMDADMWATPGLVAAHLAHYTGRRNIGVQGRWKDHPDSLNSMFMRARNVIPDATMRRREGMSPYHVVTRNFSVDAEAFHRVGGFDEGFKGYGWEDIELGFRMVRNGVTLRFEPTALGYHYHVQGLAEARAKMHEAGVGAVYFWRKHNRDRGLGLFLEILPVLLPLKWLVYRSGLITAILLPVLWISERTGATIVAGEVYSHLLWRSYYAGVFQELRRGQ
ncbi:MAG: glycosyltransferase family 2 protein [Armatimonadota bacterium]|nr:glycosyltransferase family 2 protein [Armatimonadota bacterium]